MAHLEDSTKRRIEHSSHYIHVHHEYRMEGSEGAEMLRYAMELRKPIIVYIPSERECHPVTGILDGYPHTVIRGPMDRAVTGVMEHLGIQACDETHVDHQGYY